jgi:hypothetical protein
MMSPYLAVFDCGRPSAPIPPPTHAPSDPVTPSASTRHQDTQAAAVVLFQVTTRPLPALTTIPPVLNLRSEYRNVTPPSTSIMSTKHRIKSHLPVLHQWLPPHCQTSCFFSVGTFLVFPGFSTALPTPLLEQQMPYMSTRSAPATPTRSHPPPSPKALPRSIILYLVGSMEHCLVKTSIYPQFLHKLYQTSQDVATAYPLPLSCDPFTSTPTTPSSSNAQDHSICQAGLH